MRPATTLSPTAHTDATGTIARRTIVAACIGSALEWYDVFAYLYFSLTISKLFFPADDPLVSLLLAVGTFGLSYLAKPLGALFFASYADRVSRKDALTYTLSLMAFGVALITFTPSYATIGVAASIVMLLARFIQGFSSGGEYGTSTAFLVEQSPPSRRGFYSSWNISAIGLTSVLGGVVGLGINAAFSAEQIIDFAWRIPFALGLLILPVSIYIRRRIPEKETQGRPAAPLTEVLSNHKALSLLGMGAFAPVTISNYVLAFFMPTFAIRFLGLPASAAFIGTMIYGLLQCFLSPCFGYLSDTYDRRRMMTIAALILALVALPCFFLLVTSPSLATLVISEVVLGVAATAYQAPMPAFLCDLYPARLRATGVAVVHDITATFLGGFTPFIITLLVANTGSNLIPGIYLGAAAAIAFVCMCALGRYARSAALHPERDGIDADQGNALPQAASTL
jgi:MFS transporter, MHS family, proline/betaine transporter